MTTVHEELQIPGGDDHHGRVVVFLAGTDGELVDGFIEPDITVVATLTPPVVAGEWTADLTPNSLIVPAGTRWRRQVHFGSLIVADEYLDVPVSGSTVEVQDILDEAPGAIASSALSAEIARAVAAEGALDVRVDTLEAGGGPGGTSYTHTQASPSATWIITHNLGYRPNVHVVDTGGDVIDTDIAHSSVNALTLTFAAPTSGTAHLS